MNFQSEPLKTITVLFLHFTAWWGWIAFALLVMYNIIPDKWYIALSLFAITTIWAFFMNGVAQRYRRSGNG